MNLPNFSNRPRALDLVVGCLILQSAFIGCTSTDEPGPTQSPVATSEGNDQVMGEKVFEDQVSETSKFSIYRQKDGLMLKLDAHMDKDEKVIPGLENAMKSGSVLEAYNLIQSFKAVAVPAPKIILDLEAESKANEALVDKETAAPGAGDLNGENAPAAGIPLAKAGAGEPAWDWGGDATWFKGVVRSGGSADHEYFATNKTWAWVQRKGYHHFAVGMAASHIATAKFKGLYESCGLFECSWYDHFNITLQPRRYQSYSWRNSSKKYLRKFEMTGLEPSPRVHLGVTWDDSHTPPPAPSKHDLAVTKASLVNNYLTWRITNTGSTTLTRPWIRFTYAGTPGVDEWQIPATLAPGQSYGDTRYAGVYGSSAQVFIDSKGLIAESNEFNNIVTANNVIR